MDIVPFSKVYDRSSFCCGKAVLDDWLRTQASQQERSHNTRTFLAVEGVHVLGYYATTTYRLELDAAARMYGGGKRRYPVPAVLLARLAVDQSVQGRGYGARLLIHALTEIARASQSVGFEVVVVHAIDAEAVAFYAKAGFTQFDDHGLHLFMPVKHLLMTLGHLD